MIIKQALPFEVWWVSKSDRCHRHAASFANSGSAVLFSQQLAEAPDTMGTCILSRKDRSYQTMLRRWEAD